MDNNSTTALRQKPRPVHAFWRRYCSKKASNKRIKKPILSYETPRSRPRAGGGESLFPHGKRLEKGGVRTAKNKSEACFCLSPHKFPHQRGGGYEGIKTGSDLSCCEGFIHPRVFAFLMTARFSLAAPLGVVTLTSHDCKQGTPLAGVLCAAASGMTRVAMLTSTRPLIYKPGSFVYKADDL